MVKKCFCTSNPPNVTQSSLVTSRDDVYIDFIHCRLTFDCWKPLPWTPRTDILEHNRACHVDFLSIVHNASYIVYEISEAKMTQKLRNFRIFGARIDRCDVQCERKYTIGLQLIECLMSRLSDWPMDREINVVHWLNLSPHE